MALRLARAVVLAAAGAALGAGAADAPAPRASAASRPAAAPAARGVVEIRFEQDAAHRLTVRYRAPAAVTRLEFMLHDPRIDEVFRRPMLQPANDCAALVPGAIELRHGKGCDDGALFVVQPRVLAQNAFSEPAQPSGDGGVLFYSGYYAAAAKGLDLRWQFVPEAGGYVVDDGRRQTGVVTLSPAMPAEGKAPPAIERDSEPWLRQLHALNYVYLGHTPTESADGLLYVRDPALPRASVDAVEAAARIAWQGYAEAAQATPAGPAAIVLLRAPALPNGFRDFHGDRTEGNMLRLSFIDPPANPGPEQVERWSAFVAHEIAHLWNQGVFRSDFAEPWLHEGDADWAAFNVLHQARVMSDASLVRRLDAAINTCLVVRGEEPAWSFPKSWRDGRDDPYACGVALQFLGWAALHRRDPAAIDSPLERWGELHRRFPEMGPVGFSTFFDEGGKPLMHDLLLEEKMPFASTYRKDLASLLPVQALPGELPDATLRERVARSLFGIVARADCDQLGFSTLVDSAEIVVDADVKCRAIPAGSHVVAIAGERAMTQPHAAWLALQRQCAEGRRFKLGVAGRAPVDVACPAALPPAPVAIRLPADVLRRLQLMPRPVYAGAAASDQVSSAASSPP